MKKNQSVNCKASWLHPSGKNGPHKHVDLRQQQDRRQKITEKLLERHQMRNQKPSKNRKKAIRKIDAEIAHLKKQIAQGGESHGIRAKGQHCR